MESVGKRVLVLGGCGAGKTTFSKKLAGLTGLPLVHLDRIGWRGEWEKTPPELFDARLREILGEDCWIIDGNWSRTIPGRLARADTVFWFRFSGLRCFFGVVERFFRDYGKSRDDMGGNCPERLDFEKLKFFHYALWNTRKSNRRIGEFLKTAPHVKKTVFRSRKEADAFLVRLAEEKRSAAHQISNAPARNGTERKKSRGMDGTGIPV